jgi:rare lipoprotein A
LTALRIRPAIFAYLVGFAVLAVAAAPATANTGGMAAGQAQSDGSLTSAPGQFLGKPIKFRGKIAAARNGETIEIQRLDAAAGWTVITTTTAGVDGKFTASWLPISSGRLQVRAVPTSATVRAASTIPTSSISIYKSYTATWFGPGFFGSRTSCGKRMTRKLMGVAHKTLKCGTKVELYYKGRRITVPVVDRGPFRAHTEYDLTYAAAKKLRFKQTKKLGALVVTP